MAERLFSAFPNSDHSSFPTRLLSALHAVDWANSPAGEIGDWPADLRSTVRATLRAASPMAVLIGREGIVVCNAAARELFGDAFDTAQGRPIFDVLPLAGKFYRKVIDDAYLGRNARLRDYPVTLRRDRRRCVCWFNLGISPITDDHGGVAGTWLVGSETTDHIRTRKALDLAHERMEIALEAGGIVGTWDFDVVSRKAVIDGGLAAQYGVAEADARDGLPIEMLAQSIHPQERADVLAALDAAVSSGQPLHRRFRATTGEGRLRWYVTSGRPIRDGRGAIVAFAGVVIDITGETEAAAALRHSNLRFETLVEAIPQIVWSTDAQGRHDYFNSRWSEFTGVGADRITPDIWTGMVHPDDGERVAAAWREALATGGTYDIDYRFRRHDGVYRWLRVIAMPMRDCDGNILRWYGTSTDIDDAKQLDASRELVNRELDHRIKNLFALVNGLVGLAAREEPRLAPLTEALRARLAALHRAHELIRSRPGREGGSFRRLLGELLAPFLPRGADGVEISGDAFVRAEAVTSMAFIFHELATNTAKYGALKDMRGRLRIAVERKGGWFEVAWEERFAAEAPAQPAASGFGSKLLDAVVGRQLGGAWRRDYSPDGLVVTLRLPGSLFGEKGGTGLQEASPA
jgi:PAS domain S-box-containing protein